MSMTTRRRDPFRTISARHHEDIASLVHGLIAFDQASSIKLDPVVAAAVLAFGFVYIHPFEDGNGLTWHDGFNPPASTFRFSAAVLRQNRRIQGRIRKLRVDCFHASNRPYSTGQRQGPE